MKHLLFFAAIFFCSAITFAQQTNQTPLAGAKPKADTLEWTTGTSHDFGTIKLNDIVSYTFEFTNNGKKPVTIIKASPSCSCTVPDYTKEPVLPAQKGMVKATFNAHKPGVIDKTITVTTDINKTVVLKITGEVIQ